MLKRRENELGYRASSVWKNLGDNDGDAVKTARWVLGIEGFASDGLTFLWDRDRLDLSVQALILETDPQFHDLFTDEERRQAQWTLDELRKKQPPQHP